jgi:hypothetical protein
VEPEKSQDSVKQNRKYDPAYRSLGFTQPDDCGTRPSSYNRLGQMHHQRQYDRTFEITAIDDAVS